MPVAVVRRREQLFVMTSAWRHLVEMRHNDVRRLKERRQRWFPATGRGRTRAGQDGTGRGSVGDGVGAVARRRMGPERGEDVGRRRILPLKVRRSEGAMMAGGVDQIQ